MAKTSNQRRTTKASVTVVVRRRQSKEELAKLHDSLRSWHAQNKEHKYGDPEAIQEAVLRGSDRANRTEWDIWYGLPVKVKMIKRSQVAAGRLTHRNDRRR